MSGGGKSTLINLIPRFYDVSDGEIRIDGTNIKSYLTGSLRNQIGLVQQDNILFSDTIKENILLGRPDATDEEVIANGLKWRMLTTLSWIYLKDMTLKLVKEA